MSCRKYSTHSHMEKNKETEKLILRMEKKRTQWRERERENMKKNSYIVEIYIHVCS